MDFINKKTSFAAVLPLLFCVSTAAVADDIPAPSGPVTVDGGVVHFTGQIINAPCAVDNDSLGQTVELGQYKASKFTEAGQTSEAKPFTIGLTDCSVDVYKKASITFSGPTDAGKNNILALGMTDESNANTVVAKGVGIQILSSGKAVAVDGSTPAPAQNLQATGKNKLYFTAQYISTDKNVSAGLANANADFTVTYQ